MIVYLKQVMKNKALKVTAQADKKSKKVSGKIIDIDDDNFELDL